MPDQEAEAIGGIEGSWIQIPPELFRQHLPSLLQIPLGGAGGDKGEGFIWVAKVRSCFLQKN